MKVALISLTLLICFGKFGLTMAFAQQQVGEFEFNKELSSADLTERRQAAEKILAERTKLITALMQVVEKTDDSAQFNSPQYLAIELLGNYRSLEAIKLLVKKISLLVNEPSFEINPLDGFPVAKALVKIGNPAIDGIFDNLSSKVNDLELQLYAAVIRQIDGEALGLYRLQLALHDSPGLKKKEQLEKLINFYQKRESIK